MLKTTDRGSTWLTASNGLFDTRIQGLYVYPGDTEGKHVLCGTPSGIWESLDGESRSSREYMPPVPAHTNPPARTT